MTGRKPDIETELDLARGSTGLPLSDQDRSAIRAWFSDPCLELWQDILWRVVATSNNPKKPGISILEACRKMGSKFASESIAAREEGHEGPIPCEQLVLEALRYATH